MAMQTDIGAAYTRAIDQASGVVAGIRSDQYTLQTPCDLWNTHELLTHLVGSCQMMAASGAGQKMPQGMSGTHAIEGMGDVLGNDPAAAYRSASAAALAEFAAPGALEKTWKLPFGEFPGEVVRSIHFMETVAHTWDLAKTTGQLDKLDPELAELANGAAHGIVAPEFRNEKGDPFKAEVPVPPSAPAYDRYAGFLGRHP